MWEKNDKSGDRTIDQEAVQPSGGQPSGGGMLLAGSMVQEESREWDKNKGEMRNHGKHLGPISAAGWSRCRFGVGMADEVMSQGGDRETTRTRDSVQVFMWQPHS